MRDKTLSDWCLYNPVAYYGVVAITVGVGAVLAASGLSRPTRIEPAAWARINEDETPDALIISGSHHTGEQVRYIDGNSITQQEDGTYRVPFSASKLVLGELPRVSYEGERTLRVGDFDGDGVLEARVDTPGQSPTDIPLPFH